MKISNFFQCSLSSISSLYHVICVLSVSLPESSRQTSIILVHHFNLENQIQHFLLLHCKFHPQYCHHPHHHCLSNVLKSQRLHLHNHLMLLVYQSRCYFCVSFYWRWYSWDVSKYRSQCQICSCHSLTNYLILLLFTPIPWAWWSSMSLLSFRTPWKWWERREGSIVVRLAYN